MEQILYWILGSAIVFYCLWAPKAKWVAIVITAIFGLFFMIFARDAEDYKHPERFSKEYIRVLESRGTSLAEVGQDMENATPLVKAAPLFLIVVIFILAALVMIWEDIITSTRRKITFKLCKVSFFAMLYFLSLFAGLSIPLTTSIPKRYLYRLRRLL